MDGRAHLVIRDSARSGLAPTDRPQLALGPEMPLGAPHAEKERIAHETGQAEVAMSDATPVQISMLQRLANAAPDLALRFQSVATLELFLKATAREPDADTFSDERLKSLWAEIAGATPAPRDYELVTKQEIEYGGGGVRVGMRDGVPFEKPIKEKRRTASTYDDCVALAKKKGGAYGIEAGWHLCLEKNLPDAPDSVEIDGHEYVDCIGFGLSPTSGDPIFGFAEGADIIEFSVAQVLGTKLSTTAQLWLDSYERWRTTKKQEKQKKRQRT